MARKAEAGGFDPTSIRSDGEKAHLAFLSGTTYDLEGHPAAAGQKKSGGALLGATSIRWAERKGVLCLFDENSL